MSIAEDLQQKIDRAIIRLKNFEPEEGYYLAFSGGKDSQCIYHLAKRGGVKFDAHYSVTSVDPPEVVQFIKRQYPDVIFNYPRDKDGNRITMWNLIQRNSTPPTRLVRYCCRALKENGGVGRVVVTGVRWAESVRRAANQDLLQIRGKPRSSQKLADAMGLEYQITKFNSIVLNDDNDVSRRFVEQCYRTCKVMVNPIIDWTDDDVWTYLNDVEDVRHCELYDRGWKRIGCIACPQAAVEKRKKQLDEYPTYKRAYLRAFESMLAKHKENGKECTWETPEEVMDWWLSK